jgi:N-methylhydantoinase A
MKQVMIPKFASAYCAFGMQLPDFSQDYVRTYSKRIADANFNMMNTLYEEMESEGMRVLLKSGAQQNQIRFERSADLRYVGQFHEVEVPCPAGKVGAASVNEVVEAFHRKHDQTYAFSMKGRHVEVVYLRVRAIAATPSIHLKEIEQGSESPAKARKADRLCFFGKRAGWLKTEVYEASALVGGNKISGPALIEEAGSTILVPSKARAEVDAHGNYMIHV